MIIRPKIIAVDVGDVLYSTKPDEQYRRLALISGKSVEETRKIVEKNNLPSDFELGKMSSTDFEEYVCNSLEIKISQKMFEEIWNSILDKPNYLLINQLLSLKDGYELILASNTNEIHWKMIRSKFKEMNFEITSVLSFEIGFKKPDYQFFKKILATSDVNPEDVLFIDDSLKNINEASSLGMVSHQYLNNKETMNFLSSL